MNTVLVRYGHPVRTKQYTNKTEHKTYSESRDIDENDIVQWLGEMFGRMTPNSVCLWRHREYGDSNKR